MPRINWLLLFAGMCLLASAILSLYEVFRYSQTFTRMPAGLTLAGVPVGGLTEEQALEQLVTTYSTPVELRYRDEVILLSPGAVGFQVNAGVMLPQALQFRSSANFWNGLWDYLWLRTDRAGDVPLRASYSQDRLRAFLQDVAARYDRPGSPPTADASTLGYKPGEPGHTLNLEAAVPLIETALRSPTERTVILPVVEQTSITPTFETLGELLQENTRRYQFDGVLSVYLYDLKTGQELNLTLSNGEPITGPVAYSGMSTIKIPIMVSYFARSEGDLTKDADILLRGSIDASRNTYTDLLLKTIGQGDGLEGTRVVTADMQRLGLTSTYISGLLDVFGKVLVPYATPANSRSDLNLQPDPYNQTTAEEMGTLLVMIEQCTRGGGGLMAAFPGQFTPEECQKMVQLLTNNELGPALISGGSPGGVVAHKHGWDTVPLTNIGDAALVFTPGGNYALTIYLHRAETIGYEEANRIIISMARAVYNFYNQK